MTRLVIFDLDGTLVDTPRAIVRAIAASFTAAGVEPPPAPAIRATIGLPLERAFGQLIGSNIDDPRVVSSIGHYQHYFKEFVLPNARALVFAGVAEGLATLGDQGFSLAVATSKYYRSADALLVAAGLREHFEVVVGADQVTLPKPNPEMAESIMRQLAASAAGALMVGDTTHDLVMANAAGMRSIAVTYGVHSRSELDLADPTWTADSFEDVVKRVQDAFDSTREKGDAL
jgi:phosphoglycolate phosphatase